MKTTDTKHHFNGLFAHLFQKQYPRTVIIPDELCLQGNTHRLFVMDCPRLSVCLSLSADYMIQQGGRISALHLNRGEMVYVPSGCGFEPYPQARYLSLGILLHPNFTRFLLARSRPAPAQKISHKFLLTLHTASLMDNDGLNICHALENCHGLAKDDCYLTALAVVILRKAEKVLNSPEKESEHTKGYFTWQAACQFIKEHVAMPLSRKTLSEFLHIHPNHVSRLFGNFSGCTFNQYVLQARLKHACSLLRNPALNVGEVANLCGFPDANYFIRCFKKCYGVPPGKYRGSSFGHFSALRGACRPASPS